MVATIDIDQGPLADDQIALGTSTAMDIVDRVLPEIVMRPRELLALDGLAGVGFDVDPAQVDHVAGWSARI